MSEHNHPRGGDVAFGNCPACREERRYEIEADADFWGGRVIWNEDDNE